MRTDQSEKPGFQIGIAMAGAVSAGAYTAGVFDFMMEALSEWEKAKERGDDVPQHDVFISAVSGTSAGGITAALGLASVAGGVRPTEQPAANPEQIGPIRRVLPELYDVWVKRTKLFAPVGKTTGSSSPALLDTKDINAGKLPRSLLNSDVLTAIARESLSSIRPTGKGHRFFTAPTHLFLTHTNLDGVPYPIAFEDDVYWMSLHEDRAHFALSGLGQHPFPKECRWLETWHDPGDPIDLRQLGTLAGAPADRPLMEPFEQLAQSALTTSAFPFGLSARQISVDPINLRRRALPFDAGTFPDTLLKQDFGSIPAIKRANFVCVDGGTLNNEPFEIVRWTIRDLNEAQNSRDPRSANRAVILIAPFPPQSRSNFEVLGTIRDLGVGFVGKTLLPALVDQARFKASDLIAAADPKVYSRYLIAPVRVKGSNEPALACGALYAFGGFIDEQFREHDFQLGRRNCQWFLRKHFMLHPSNPVFGAEADSNAPEGAERSIIPLVGTADVPLEELPPWPQLERSQLFNLRRALLHRLDALAAASLNELLKSFWLLRIAVKISWWRNRNWVADHAMRIVVTELDRAHQLKPLQPVGFWRRLLRHTSQ